ncbi:MAG: hypothetical protein IJA35_06675 [Clostridia bacterium]|nr:hypothetical protein [Clostridia bacterium]
MGAAGRIFPLAKLDEQTAKKVEDMLLSIKGKTILIVPHQFNEEKLNSFDDILELKPSIVG